MSATTPNNRRLLITLLLLISGFCISDMLLANSNPVNSKSSPDNLVGHGGPVNTVAISPDGSTAISGSLDYSMMVWDIKVSPAKSVHRFSNHDGHLSVVKFLPFKF